MNNLINQKPFYISNILDNTNESKVVTYRIITDFEDDYCFKCDNSVSLVLLDEYGNYIADCEKEMIINLKANSIYHIQVTTSKANENFYLRMYSFNSKVAVPYKQNIVNDGKDIPLYSKDNETKPALIESIKRKGGTYIYSNVPESMPAEVVNTILMQNTDLTGDCFMTYEHQNKTGLPYVYMGYRIVNNNDHDIYVTVKNVGYQVDGSWLGEKSWMDYYGVNFDMKRVVNFDEKAYEWFDAYLHFDVNYKASPISPTTYKIPKGQYIYVTGGTSNDAYKNINVNDTANKGIKPNCCANANVFFTINNGKATGELCVYVDSDKINEENVVIQNMRRYGEHDDFGGRIGVSNHHGVIDSNPIFIFNDNTPSGYLKLKYYPIYSDTIDINGTYKPLQAIMDSYPHEFIGDYWATNLSSQYHHDYIGTDMVENDVLFEGKTITLSVNKATPAGKIWDFGNWMIEYQDNCVLVNQGDNDRKVRFYISNMGSLLYIIKDELGNILKCGATFETCEGLKPIYEVEVKAHSKVLITVVNVLPANNNGSIVHRVELV